MIFNVAPRVFHDMPMWNAVGKKFTYVVSKDGGVFCASAKPIGSVPFDKNRHDLGFYDSYAAATSACEKFERGEFTVAEPAHHGPKG